MTPLFLQAGVSPDVLSSAAEKYGVIGVLSVVVVGLLIALRIVLSQLDAKDKALDVEKDKAIAERDKRIEAERQTVREYTAKLETERALFVGVVKDVQGAILTLNATVERDQRSRP